MLASQVLARGNTRRANLLFDQALGTLGNRYATSAMLDDTGMHLILAKSEGDKGKLKQAAAIKQRVLTERLQLCGIERK